MRALLHVSCLIVLCTTLFGFRLGARPLWDIDEGMHAATSKDMVTSGDWVTPTLNGENFYDKPALFNWLVAISLSLLGFSELAARLPAALLGLAGVVVTYFLGRRMFGERAGFLGAVVLATSPLYIILSRIVVHDAALVFSMTLAWFGFYSSFAAEKHRSAYLLLFYAACGLAILAKGPMGVLLPGLVIVSFLALRGELSFVGNMRIGWGIVVCLAVAAPWYVLISLRNADYAGYFFVEQNLMRFLSPEALHSEPFYHYLPALIGGLLPWSFFLPLAFLRAWRDRTNHRHESAGAGANLFLLLWVTVIFFFFSAASSKLEIYIAPLLPAAALLLGKLWSDVQEPGGSDLEKPLFYSFLPLALAAPIAFLVILVIPLDRFHERYGVNLTSLNVVAVALLAGVSSVAYLLRRRHYAGAFWAQVGTIVTATVLIIAVLLPPVSAFRSTKVLAERLDKMIPPGQPLVVRNRLRDTALFYTNRRVRRIAADEIDAFLRTDEHVFFILKKKHLDELPEDGIGHVVAEHGSQVIVSNRPPA